MKSGTVSLATRAAWAALLSAGFAAALAAVVASGFADALLQRGTDRRLLGAASELAHELDEPNGFPSIEAAVSAEQDEATSTGIRFAVYDSNGAALAGDRHVRAIAESCKTMNELRICGVPTPSGVRVFAATLNGSRAELFLLSALTAASLAAAVAWAMGRVLSRRAVAPLVRLQTRIANMHLEIAPRARAGPGDLGANEGVSEVDDLRGAVSLLLSRMHDALDRSARFAANAAHELRTPLTALRAELELLAEEEPFLDASDTTGNRVASSDVPAMPFAIPSQKSLQRALRKVVQLQSLTERLLVLATPETSNDGASELVSLRDVVDEAIANLAEDDRSRITVPDGADILVRGDSAALGIVVSNGISNALKFGRNAVLEIGTEGEYALVAIDDDGPGVSEADREAAFEPFARGSAAHRAPGHGLGLALVAHVAKCHGGHARLTANHRGLHGARLEVRLPRVRDDLAPIGQTERERGAP